MVEMIKCEIENGERIYETYGDIIEPRIKYYDNKKLTVTIIYTD